MKAIMELNSHSNVKSASCFLKNCRLFYYPHITIQTMYICSQCRSCGHEPLYNVYMGIVRFDHRTKWNSKLLSTELTF